MSKDRIDAKVDGMTNWERQAINTIAAFELEIADLRKLNAKLQADNAGLREREGRYREALERIADQGYLSSASDAEVLLNRLDENTTLARSVLADEKEK